jgi:hypothetical protein
MIAVQLISSSFSADEIGPCGSITPVRWQAASEPAPHRANQGPKLRRAWRGTSVEVSCGARGIEG